MGIAVPDRPPELPVASSITRPDPLVVALCEAPPRLPAGSSVIGSIRQVGDVLALIGSEDDADKALQSLLATRQQASTQLNQSAGVAPTTEDLNQLATYCLVAGEAMRRARSGSQARARSFLRTALILADGTGNHALAARAAWQGALALAGGRAPAATGARRSAGNNAAVGADQTQPVAGCAAPAQGAERGLEAAFACALNRAVLAGDAKLTALAALRLARLEASRKSDIGGRITTGLNAAARLPESAEKASVRRTLLMLACDGGNCATQQLGDAVQAYDDALRAGFGDAASLFAIRGRIAMARGDAPAARGALRRAIFLESQSALPQHLPEYSLYLADAEPERASEHVAAAYRALEQLRPVLVAIDPLSEESRFDLLVRPVFDRAIGTTLALAENDPLALDQAQRIAEAYRSAELQNSLGAECVPVRNPVTPDDLLPGETLLYPLLLKDRVELLYATGGPGPRGFRRIPPNRNINRAAIAALSQRMTTSLSGDSDDWQQAAGALYAAIIAPIAHELAPGGTLIIVPDGPLRQISFAALTDPDGRFLMEQVRLTVVPALSFAAPGERDRKPVILAASLEKEMDLPVGRFSQLQGTAAEAAMAAGRDGVLLTDFSKIALANALGQRPATVLHLATHAAFNGRTERSFIVADGDTITLPELRNMLSANQLRGQTLQLLVLSACETAVGDDDQAMGLAGAAVEAGASSALASLWEVSDAGTAALMEAFYTHYRQGVGRSRALQLAQIDLARSDDGQWADPGIWAAFTLVGSWR